MTLQLLIRKVPGDAIHWKIPIHCITQLVSLILIHWMVTYKVDIAIHRLNKRSQDFISEMLLKEEGKCQKCVKSVSLFPFLFCQVRSEFNQSINQ